MIAGGQSLMPLMALRLATPAVLVDLTNVPGLDHVSVAPDGSLSIGAMARQRAVELHPLVADRAPLLGRGDRPHRPRGDPQPGHGRRQPGARRPGRRAARGRAGPRPRRRARRAGRTAGTVAAHDLFTGYLSTCIGDDELLVEVRLPPLAAGARVRRSSSSAGATATSPSRCRRGRAARRRRRASTAARLGARRARPHPAARRRGRGGARRRAPVRRRCSTPRRRRSARERRPGVPTSTPRPPTGVTSAPCSPRRAPRRGDRAGGGGVMAAPSATRVAVALARQRAAATSASVEARTTLADLLRDHLDLTGTHLGCEHGVCGACTVLIDGERGSRLPRAGRHASTAAR